jgi:hypothetical protein
MLILKEKSIKEAGFKWGTVKTLQFFGAKARITIELDLSEAIKGLRYDVNTYGISKGQLDYKYLAEVIARQLDWRAFALSTNDDHELAHALSDLNDD